ncbi:phytoene desaturase family protein [Flexivirga caeni]|uniref:Pyridine nucleotide-disulfide oxidoreductase domain-containing protein 2 n=1 Tax=Flexivirga caeni TaxID=2294115 RepID=A0A3M9M174_9MICO|nr:NAD(P)/FAD-dependent oxidoreductase [Flexivirga caeni]RNI18987.1 NAD(P)/FAD-dependent oxidoreductase [Flexivirga caeni]
MTHAVVVGSGPNGLSAAVELAAAGVEVTVLEARARVGGGARSCEGGIVAGLVQDECSAVHTMGPTSAFVIRHRLGDYGLEWLSAPIDMVHPLDGGSAGVLHRSVQDTAAGLGADGTRWRRLFGWPSEHFGALSEDIFQPLIRIPRHPIGMARFGMPTLVPAATLGRYFRTPAAQALFGGVAAHAFQPLNRPLSSAIGLGILTAGHHSGWVVARGGTQAITDAMVARLTEFGGKIETGVRVERAAQLPRADITVFDLTPEDVVRILGDRLPRRIARSFTRFRHSPGAFKVDFAVEGGVPWTNPDAHRAGTVHLGGDLAEIVRTEAQVVAGQMPQRPFVLVGQQYLADPSRSAGNVHPLYSYAHVPHGYPGDATEAIIGQIERFAPGFRDRIVGMAVRSTTQMAVYNANYVGGDIITGAKDVRQLVFGPRITASPYTIGVPGMYICSAATPPGPGAHGMCGYNAARLALSKL